MNILTGFRNQIIFQKAGLRESNRQLCNPGCGWYHIYTFRVPSDTGRESAGEEEAFYDCSKEEQLALALIDIGAYRRRELTPQALSYIKKVFSFFHSGGRQIILRFAYDTEGKGMEKEPSDIALVRRHMEQAGELVQEYAEDILVVQGIFVGRWGEMHGSAFLTDDGMAELAGTLYSATGGKCYLAVRTPVQWRRIVGHRRTEPALRRKLALFNDGIFGSETDLGTYGVSGSQRAEESWGREEELAWQEEHMDSVPNGGEALSGRKPTGYERAVRDMKRMHLCYLNSVYQPQQLAHWRNERVKKAGEWNGISGFDYIGRHLGYRFVVRNVKISNRRQLNITVENCGFAGLCEAAECFLLMEPAGGGRDELSDGAYTRQDGEEDYRVLLDVDPRSWRSGCRTTVRIPLLWKKEISGEYRLYLQLRRKRDGRILYFANEGGGDRVLLGRINVKC